MFTYTDENGNFIVESGSNAVPIMKVSGSVIYISGSILPFESTTAAFSEIGSLAKPFKELYVESASINFVDTTKAVNHAGRRVKFSKEDVDNLKAGRPINDEGVVSASGDMHVVGDSLFRGVTVNEGITKLKGATEVSGALLVRGDSGFHGNVDVIGGFRVNGNAISQDELRRLEGLTATTDELNVMDGLTATTQELNKMDGVTATTSELNIMDGVTATTQELNKMDGVTATTAELNKMDGVTATTAELNYTDGVTSNIQTQLNNKYTLGATVPSDLIPDRDARFALGSTLRKWTEVHAQNLLIDTLSSISGVHILGGAGTTTISQIPLNGLLDARTDNVFYMGVDGTINGMRGLRVTGQIVTIIQPNGRRNDFTHQSTNVNIHSTEKFVFPLNRNLSGRGPQALRFIYDGTNRCWYRLI